jgi:hypothetical protein
VIELRCKACGVAFTPTKADIIRGPAWYRLCARCRRGFELGREAVVAGTLGLL